MECSRWESEGLLHTSGELEQTREKDYEKHLAECEYCGRELALYRKERDTIFTSSVLEEPTTPELDARINKACMKMPRPAVGSGVFFSFVRRGVISTLVLCLGLGGGVFIAYNLNKDNVQAPKIAVQEIEASNQNVAAVEMADSLENDSLVGQVPRPQGNLEMGGVVPVDVQKK